LSIVAPHYCKRISQASLLSPGGASEETRITPQWPDRFAKGRLPCARWRSLYQLQFCPIFLLRHKTKAGHLRAGQCLHRDRQARRPRRRRLATVNRRSVRCRQACARKRIPPSGRKPIRWGPFRVFARIA